MSPDRRALIRENRAYLIENRFSSIGAEFALEGNESVSKFSNGSFLHLPRPRDDQVKEISNC